METKTCDICERTIPSDEFVRYSENFNICIDCAQSNDGEISRVISMLKNVGRSRTNLIKNKQKIEHLTRINETLKATVESTEARIAERILEINERNRKRR
jgi:hypothetical protein